jgi:colanic acid biosynthesis glycosyl transferase WcaI
MKILFFCQYYPPESNAPAVRISEMAERWVAAGHEVTVLTAFPHHPTGVIPREYAGRIFMREQKNGVRVVRTYVYVAANRGVIRRSLSYFSWMFSAIVFGITRVAKPDVVVATTPQFLCAVAGYVVASFKRVPYVMEVRDLWPESIVAVGVLREKSIIVSALRKIERFLYRKADRIVSVSPGFVPYLNAAGADRKLSLVPNGVDLLRFRPGVPDNDMYALHGVRQPYRVLYTGTIGMAHGLEIVVAAGEKSRGEGVAFVVVGDGARRNELAAEVAKRRLDNVYFIPMQPRDTMPDWIRGADAVLVHLRPVQLFETVLPSKLFEYMACARPVLMGVGGFAATVVESAQCGWVFPSGDADALVKLIRDVRRDEGEAQRRGVAGRWYVEMHYDRDVLARKYSDDVLMPLARAAS